MSSEQNQKIRELIGTVKWLREEQQSGDWNQELEPHEILGVALDGLGDLTGEEPAKVRKLAYLAVHPDEHPLGEIIKEYIRDKRGTIRDSSLDSKNNKLNAFSKWMGKETMLDSIGKVEARKYVIEVINKLSMPSGQALSASTKLGYINVLKSFFEWADSRGLSKDNPFRKTEAIITKGKKVTKTKVRGWKKDEVVNILESAKARIDNQLTTMIILAMYTGARGNELAELKVKDVTDWSFRIQGDVKNDHSLRNIPIHPAIKYMVDKLKETSTDDYLVSGLLRGGRDNKRLHNISKKFGRLKDKLGYKGRSTVFHSYRHTVITLLHNAHVPMERIAGIVGHTDDMNFTLNTYSDGLENDEAIKVINKVDYGSKVTELVVKLVRMLGN